MARVIFRKFGGRVVPIKIKNVKDPGSGLSYPGQRERKIIAETDKGEWVGTLSASFPKKGKHVDVNDIRVNKEFRRRGIANKMMQRLADFAQRANKDFLRSSDLQSPSMVGIRKKLGKSRFFADQFGPYGEETRRITANKARQIIRENKSPNSKGRLVTGTTMLKKRRKKR
jgi:predicted GNAT family acetyltransferase